MPTSRSVSTSPLFVSDMSFGALSLEAKVSLAKGAELAGTGICSGEGGMLPEEQAASTRYFYELASGKFGFTWDKLDLVQAFHFKLGQGAKTGTGGHLPGIKVTAKIAEVRGLEPGTDAISPSTFPDFHSLGDYKEFVDQVRDRTGGIPIGVKLSAQHIEDDIDAALHIGVRLHHPRRPRRRGRGRPRSFSVITSPFQPSRRWLERGVISDRLGRSDVTLITTGGLRTHTDFAKAMALGADAVACLQLGHAGNRVCGHASLFDEQLPRWVSPRKTRICGPASPVDAAAERLHRYFEATCELMWRAGPSHGPHPSRPIHTVRPDHVRPRDGTPDRHRLRRRAVVGPRDQSDSQGSSGGSCT